MEIGKYVQRGDFLTKYVIVGKFMFSKSLNPSKNTKYLGIMSTKSDHLSIHLGWSTIKTDYWYDTDPSTAKFFSMRSKITKDGKKIQSGIYIGRYAFVVMRAVKEAD